MKIKDKPLLYWLAWAPFALLSFAAVVAVAIVLWETIRTAPVFMVGSISLILWAVWGSWYLSRGKEAAYSEELRKMGRDRARMEITSAGADAYIAGTPCPYPDRPEFADEHQWWHEGWKRGEHLDKSLE